jgi:hypothetical protein
VVSLGAVEVPAFSVDMLASADVRRERMVTPRNWRFAAPRRRRARAALLAAAGLSLLASLFPDAESG